jgi:hypothetical protein
VAGFRGGRYISAEASARGEWEPGGAKNIGYDAYATSKQCELAAALEFARDTPRIHFNAVEPGFAPGTALGRDANAFLRFVAKYLLSPLAPHIKYWSTPELTAPVITNVLLNKGRKTGIYRREGISDAGFHACSRSAVQSPRGRGDASAYRCELEIGDWRN